MAAMGDVVEVGLVVESLCTVAADLSDLPPVPGPVVMSIPPDAPDMTTWYRWPYGSSTALVRRIDADRFMAVIPLMYTHAVVWGFIADATFGHEDRWCYHDAASAIAAASVWNGPDGGEPVGWHRHPRSGRRRDADGNEWVNP